MKIAIVGYGQMGRLIKKCAVEKNMEVVSTIDPLHPAATHRELSAEAMEGVDVCICFTQPNAAIKNIEDACRAKKQIVIGTTGWADRMPYVEDLVSKSGIGLVYSSNFSVGVNIYFRLIEQAARVIDKFDMYDISGFEAHHRLKRDSPSGTATTIGKILLKHIGRKKRVTVDKLDRKIAADELHIASLRGGHVPGTHSVLFDSEADTIELKHTARSRMGFAMGAVLASQWILGKKGTYTEADMMRQILD